MFIYYILVILSTLYRFTKIKTILYFLNDIYTKLKNLSGHGRFYVKITYESESWC